MHTSLFSSLLPLSSKTEIKRMTVFRNYKAGEPTCRLYVKNIAKQVEEKVGAEGALLDPLVHYRFLFSVTSIFVSQDLKYIYGRYIDPSSDAERNM